jgi:hypothetical protein
MADNEFVKDPQAVLDYGWDWSSWLADGETITSHTVTVPSGLTLDSDNESGGTVTAWLSGGTDNTEYRVVCQIVTSQGRTDERTLRILVQDR